MSFETTPEPLSVGAQGLADLLNISKAHLHRMDAEGHLPQGIRLGGRKLWVVEEVRAWLRAVSPAATPCTPCRVGWGGRG